MCDCVDRHNIWWLYRHQKSIVATLKDADISIRRRGLDLLFTMCNNQNVRDIVDELLKYLEIADFTMRDELVLKTAVLAERCGLDIYPCKLCCSFTFLCIWGKRSISVPLLCCQTDGLKRWKQET